MAYQEHPISDISSGRQLFYQGHHLVGTILLCLHASDITHPIPHK